jgi:hypothetical protein
MRVVRLLQWVSRRPLATAPGLGRTDVTGATS